MKQKLMKVLGAVSLAACLSGIQSIASEPDAKSNVPAPAALETLPTENAVLTDAPNVPPPITRKYSAKVIVHLEVREVTKRLADGVDYVFWTFGGGVPGKFIRIREGDDVEFHLHNHQDNKMPHNIDLHAVSGPGGGAASSFTAPGHSSQFSFKVLNPGLFIYHCAAAPVGMHVGNGMYGMILVEPKEGLPPADREYYVMQGEFYTTGKYGDQGLQGFDMDKAVDERPPYVVFNGAVGSLLDDTALTAKIGERVRLFVGNGGPNLTSSFHVIGAIFDTVYPEGGTTPLHNVQTTSIPPGGAAMVEFKPVVPGTYSLVDHALFRAFNKGAVGMLKVDGPPAPLTYSGKQSDTVYQGKPVEPRFQEQANVTAVKPQANQEVQGSAKSGDPMNAQISRGKAVYMQSCFVCHQPDGQGVTGQIPPLAKSDFLAGLSKDDYIRGVVLGRSGQIKVNGKPYNGIMVPMNYLSDQQLADVLTYVRKSFGNSGEAVTPQEVGRTRQQAPPTAQTNYE